MTHEYTDWQHHFEDCPDCRKDKPCDKGKKIREKQK